MAQFLWKKYKTDLLFLGVVLLLLLGGLLLALLSQWKGGGEGHPVLLLTGTSLIAPTPPILPQLFGPLINTVTGLYQGALAWLSHQGSLLTYTDPALTYNPSVVGLWESVLAIADATVGVFIVIAGYQILLGSFGLRYAEALEVLPRLIFACIGANISFVFARFWIDLNNLLCAIMMAQVANRPFSAFTIIAITLTLLPLSLLLLILIITLGLQMAVRLGILLFLMVCLPALFILLASRHTQRLAQAGIQAYVTAVLLQALQLTCLVVGGKVLLPFLARSIGPTTELAPFATVLAGITLLWVTLRIPSMLRQWALQPIAESGQAIRSLAFASFVQILFFRRRGA